MWSSFKGGLSGRRRRRRRGDALSDVAIQHADHPQTTTLDGSIYNSSRGSSTNESVDEFDVEQVIPIHSLQEKLWGVKEGAISSQNLYEFMELLKIDMLEMQVL